MKNSIWGEFFDDATRVLGYQDAAAYVEAFGLDLIPEIDDDYHDTAVQALLAHMENRASAAGIDIDEI